MNPLPFFPPPARAFSHQGVTPTSVPASPSGYGYAYDKRHARGRSVASTSTHNSPNATSPAGHTSISNANARAHAHTHSTAPASGSKPRPFSSAASAHLSNLRATLSNHGASGTKDRDRHARPSTSRLPSERRPLGFRRQSTSAAAANSSCPSSPLLAAEPITIHQQQQQLGPPTSNTKEAPSSSSSSTTRASTSSPFPSSSARIPSRPSTSLGTSNLSSSIAMSSNSSASSNRESDRSDRSDRVLQPTVSPVRLSETWSLNAAAQGRSPDAASPPPSLSQSTRRPSRSGVSISVPSGRTGLNLPKGLYFDWVRPEEVAQCHALEVAAYEPADQASKDRLKYRQTNAPHLFLGAFLPSSPPKVAGPLSVGHNSTPRKLIGFATSTASSSLSARSIAVHSVSNPDEGEEAWLVCLHSIVVDEAYRRKGVGLRLLEQYMTRLRRSEEGRGDARKGNLETPKGYECVALLTHEENARFFRKAGFNMQGVSHVRVGSGGWVEMRRYIRGRHRSSETKASESEGEQPELEVGSGDAIDESLTSAIPIASPEDTSTSAPSAMVGQEGVGTIAPSSEAHAGVVDPADDPSAQTTAHSVQPNQRSSSLLPASHFASDSASKASPATNDGASGGGLGGFTQFDLLAALRASTPSYAPGTNPSLAFSSVLGQTLAGKTFVEDAYIALEARLVDKRKGKEDEGGEGEGSNLAEIWCPREECGCKLVRRGVALWELAESGPLSDEALSLASLPSGASPLPPTPQPPPAPASHIRALEARERERLKKGGNGKSSADADAEPSNVRSTLPGAPPSGEVSTPIRPFWSLLSPMSFDNIGFSNDVQWKVPQPSSSLSRYGSGSSGGEEVVVSSGGEESNEVPSKSPPSSSTRGKLPRRPTFFGGGKKDKNKDKKEKEREDRFAHIQHLHRPENHGDKEVSEESGNAATPSPPLPPASPRPRQNSSRLRRGSSNQQQQQQRPPPPPPTTLTVKYLLCGSCDTGPLGYTIVPPRLTGGRMGQTVGEELGGGAGTGDVEESGATQALKEEDIQVFLLAADRVRYRFIK